jgi:twitching motility protein PilT
MIDTVNIERRGHILTVEDPIEFVHTHKNCIVNQREIHTDAPSFGIALRAALREDPDVVLIGEVRDLETVEVALRIAETGHLTLATLHTGSAVQTLNRVIHMFPAGQQDQARQQLAMVLEGVVCQALVPTADGNGRVVAIEVLVATPGIRNLIREGKVQQVYSAMQVGQERAGMQTMNQALAALYRRRQITLEAAMAHSPNRPELQEMVTKASDGAPAGSTRADRWNTRV